VKALQNLLQQKLLTNSFATVRIRVACFGGLSGGKLDTPLSQIRVTSRWRAERFLFLKTKRENLCIKIFYFHMCFANLRK